uniref:Secreted protein n=1 Tax=Mesocestoides corti TaxID=53468 RepID=A0A5K3EW52_MESCO
LFLVVVHFKSISPATLLVSCLRLLQDLFLRTFLAADTAPRPNDDGLACNTTTSTTLAADATPD